MRLRTPVPILTIAVVRLLVLAIGVLIIIGRPGIQIIHRRVVVVSNIIVIVVGYGRVHRAGDVQDQDDVHGFFGGGSGGGAGGVGLQGQQTPAGIIDLPQLQTGCVGAAFGDSRPGPRAVLIRREGRQGHQGQGHDQRQHKGQRLFPFSHILVPPIAFICAVRIFLRPGQARSTIFAFRSRISLRAGEVIIQHCGIAFNPRSSSVKNLYCSLDILSQTAVDFKCFFKVI